MIAARRTVRLASQETPEAERCSNAQLKPPKKPVDRHLPPAVAVPGSCGLSKSAHIAGDSVSETISEMIVAPAIVSANCR